MNYCPHTGGECMRSCDYNPVQDQMRCMHPNAAEPARSHFTAADVVPPFPNASKAPVLVMRETNLRNVPATLRKLADDIEAEKPTGCVVVWEGSKGLHVSYCGEGEAPPNAHLLLHAGALKLLTGGTQ